MHVLLTCYIFVLFLIFCYLLSLYLNCLFTILTVLLYSFPDGLGLVQDLNALKKTVIA